MSTTAPLPPFYKGTYARMRWQMMREIKTQLLKVGGCIFGGYVRDSLIHDYYADKFYAACLSSETSLNYDDPMHHPESWPWRTYLPEDIDVVMTTFQLNELKNTLTQKGFITDELYTCPANIYMHANGHNVVPPTLQLTRIKVKIALANIFNIGTMPCIKIDVLHCVDFKGHDLPPFGVIDFECNSLVLSKDGCVTVHSADNILDFSYNMLHCHQQTARIVQDIIALRAVAVTPQRHRIKKMLQKGFTLIDKCVQLIPTIYMPKYDGVCIICHEQIDHKEGTASENYCIKNVCCDAHYHPVCFCNCINKSVSEYNNSDNCIMCRTPIYTAINYKSFLSQYAYKKVRFVANIQLIHLLPDISDVPSRINQSQM